MIDRTEEPASPKPRKRWRKTKWFYGVLLAYYAVTITATLSWTAYSHRKFREAVDPIIARGEPLAWSDFATEPIPDDQNAAILYRQATEMLLLSDSEPEYSREFRKAMDDSEWEFDGAIDGLLTSPEMRRKHPEDMRKVLDMGRDILALCRKARQLDKVDWAIDYDIAALEFPALPCGIQQCREIVELLSLAAIDAHENGRDDEAIEYIRDGLALGDALSYAPCTVTHLVTIAIYSISSQPLEEILPGIKIGDAPGSVSADNLRSLITDLMDTDRCSRSLALAVMSVRSSRYDSGRCFINMGTVGGQGGDGRLRNVYGARLGSAGITGWGYDVCVGSLWRIETARAVSYLDAYVNISNARTLPEFKRDAPQTHDCSEHVFPRVLSCMLLPAFERTFVMHYQTLMKRQMAGVAIAVRMYQIDHGRLPDTLGQLVPDYLAEVPQDPMGEPGTRIRYVNDPNTPLLYSVGRDGRDDGGNHKDLVDGVYACKDIPWFLNGRPVMPEKESAPDDGDD